MRNNEISCAWQGNAYGWLKYLDACCLVSLQNRLRVGNIVGDGNQLMKERANVPLAAVRRETYFSVGEILEQYLNPITEFLWLIGCRGYLAFI